MLGCFNLINKNVTSKADILTVSESMLVQFGCTIFAITFEYL